MLINKIILINLFALFYAIPAFATSISITNAKQQTHRFDVVVASTQKEQQQGLMFKKELPKTRGMLFDLRPERIAHIWMKNTYIPLDVLFINNNGRITEIYPNRTPLSTDIISSKNAIRYVLEINASLAHQLEINIGDQMIIEP